MAKNKNSESKSTKDSTKKKVKILGIELGYESGHADTLDDKPPQLYEVFKKLFKKRTFEDWDKPRTYEIEYDGNDGSTQADFWAARYLRKQINKQLRSSDNAVRVHDMSDMRAFTSLQDVIEMGRAAYGMESRVGMMTGSHGTRCKQKGDRWINSRTYRLTFDESGMPWPEGQENVLVFATVTWLCWEPKKKDKKSG